MPLKKSPSYHEKVKKIKQLDKTIDTYVVQMRKSIQSITQKLDKLTESKSLKEVNNNAHKISEETLSNNEQAAIDHILDAMEYTKLIKILQVTKNNFEAKLKESLAKAIKRFPDGLNPSLKKYSVRVAVSFGNPSGYIYFAISLTDMTISTFSDFISIFQIPISEGAQMFLYGSFIPTYLQPP